MKTGYGVTLIGIDWEKESVGVARRRYRFQRDDVIIPLSYSSQNFHGITGGYLNSSAAVTYATGSIDANMGAAGFKAVRSQDV